ncbi:MAG TPA: hypothetical protein VH681_05545, partial [Nitrospiraceae bacterium]
DSRDSIHADRVAKGMATTIRRSSVRMARSSMNRDDQLADGVVATDSPRVGELGRNRSVGWLPSWVG